MEELERRHWDRKLTKLPEKNINVALVKEFYANVYGFEDGSPKQCNIRFNAQTLNTFLETPVVLQEGETYPTFPQFLHTYLDH